jgi:hypothetical protein
MQALLSNWNLFRILRVALGIFILVQGIVGKDTFSIVMGTVFAGMALFNLGCCGAGGCATDTTFSKKGTETTEVIFEEVTDKNGYCEEKFSCLS